MNTKRRWETFSFYDRSGIARHLEAMAARGWLLEAIGPLGWKYRRCLPRQLRFAVTYYPKATVYDPAPSQEQEFFYDLCAHDGWVLAASSGEMQVFYNDYPAPTPIETDPALEVETIHKLAWRRVLLPWGLILTFSLFAVIGTAFSFWGAPLKTLSSNHNLMLFCTGLLLLPLGAAELWGYLDWESNARQAAQRGIFLETKSHWRLQLFVSLALLACVICWMLTSPLSEWYPMLVIFLAMLLAAALRVFMKRLGVDAEMTQGTVFSVVFGIIWLLTSFSPLLPVQPLRSGPIQAWVETPPLSPTELVGEQEDFWTYSEGTASLLLGQFRYNQPAYPFYTSGFSNLHFGRGNLAYTVTLPRFTPLYDFSRAVLLHDWGDGVRRHSETIDPGPWGANEAYQCFDLYEREYKEYHYLIFYDQVLVELELLEEVTPEQKALVGTRFQTLDP